jgi:hypothetical protein
MHDRTTAETVRQLLLQQKSVEYLTVAYTPDPSPRDFFLFGTLKERNSGTSYSSPDALISVRCELIASLPKDKLVSVYKNWMKRLNRAIQHRGWYYRM